MSKYVAEKRRHRCLPAGRPAGVSVPPRLRNLLSSRRDRSPLSSSARLMFVPHDAQKTHGSVRNPFPRILIPRLYESEACIWPMQKRKKKTRVFAKMSQKYLHLRYTSAATAAQYRLRIVFFKSHTRVENKIVYTVSFFTVNFIN